MIIRGLSREQLEECARQAQVRLYNMRPKGTGWALVLRPMPELCPSCLGSGGIGHCNRCGASGYVGSGDKWRSRKRGRRVWAVCFHGHMDFMLRVFDKNVQATIISSIARYDGLRNFAEKFMRVGELNVGSMLEPVCADEACDCDREETLPLVNELRDMMEEVKV